MFFQQKEEKKVLKIFFHAISKKKKKKGFQRIFSSDFLKRKTNKVFANFSGRFLAFSDKLLTVQKIVLSSSREQGNFRGLEVKAKDYKIENYKKDVLKVEDVLKDSTSGRGNLFSCCYSRSVIAMQFSPRNCSIGGGKGWIITVLRLDSVKLTAVLRKRLTGLWHHNTAVPSK